MGGRGSTFLGAASSQYLDVFTIPVDLRMPSFGALGGLSLHMHDWLNHWPLVINSACRPSAFPRVGDGAESSKLLVKARSFWKQTLPILKFFRDMSRVA